MDYGFVAPRMLTVRERVAAACARSGRKPEDVVLVPVTTFHPVAAIRAACDCGMRVFGEHRVREAESTLPYAEIDAAVVAVLSVVESHTLSSCAAVRAFPATRLLIASGRRRAE
jgi:hypothetical protein